MKGSIPADIRANVTATNVPGSVIWLFTDSH